EDDNNGQNYGNGGAAGTSVSLKSSSPITVGMMTDYDMLGVADYMATAAANASQTTFGSAMTHGAIVQDDGSMDFSKADAMVTWAKNNGLGVLGRTLVWHKNQNATYLGTVAAPPVSEFLGPNLIPNPAMDENIDGWSQMNPNPTGGCGLRIAQGEGRNGTQGLHVDGTCEAVTLNDYWRVQVAAPTATAKMEAGSNYRIEFWIKAKVAGPVQFEIRGGATEGDLVRYIAPIDVGTDWTKITIDHTALGTETGVFTFDLNNANHTEYWIDDMAVYQVSDTPLNMAVNPAMDDNIDGWSQMNPNSGGACGLRIAQDEGRNGTKGIYVDGTCDAITLNDYWRVQIATNFSGKMTAGVDYIFEFWIKSLVAGTVQFEIRGGNTEGDLVRYVLFDVTADWTKVTIMHTALGTETGVITFDLNNANHTKYWIDDVSVKQYVAGGTGEITDEDRAKVDNAMRIWITDCINHFKGDVHAWDVVNEPMADGNSGLRTSANTNTEGATDIFFWSDFLGRDYALKAFQYAAAADPNALLFINDNNLESNSAKLDSLIAYVNELKAKGAKIDGIGTAMHVNIATSKTGIDYMFQKLAATGLKIRISELDVTCNNVRGFVLTPQVLDYQAATYHDVVVSYLQNIPAAQRQDITVWGVDDANSWLYNDGTDFPLLFDGNYVTKPAFDGFLQGLKGQ
ncbi:MAG: endo-1,4-beta-xylanase, partial [Tannerella sp.]|nr:endo-1,4-beta-xylanase [Tannerella sp.]